MTLQCGLFGKVVARRDFVSIHVPRWFLNGWEPWLQQSLAASRNALAEGWTDAFLTAPIWRFWLGAAILGRGATGAIMASTDQAGRCFPLTLVACGEEGAEPAADPTPDSGWFAAVETFLLHTLDPAVSFEGVKTALAALPSASRAGEGQARKGGPHDRTHSLWWTLGGLNAEAAAFDAPGLPTADRFAFMLAHRRSASTSG
jgi:type VI secretion system protein ImpM